MVKELKQLYNGEFIIEKNNVCLWNCEKGSGIFTASCSVFISDEILGCFNGLYLCVTYRNTEGKYSEKRGNSIPAQPGIWEATVTFEIPYSALDIRVCFKSRDNKLNELIKSDIIKLCDIRITESDGKVAPFCQAMTAPFADIIINGFCIRRYDSDIKIKDTDFVNWLLYARNHHCSYDLNQVKAMNMTDAKRFYYGLIINKSIIFEKDQIVDMIYGLDSVTTDIILENLSFNEEWEVAEYLIEKLRMDTVISKLVKVNIYSKDNDMISARETFNEINNDITQIGYIIGPSEATVKNYHSFRWLNEHLDEIKKRANQLAKKRRKISREKMPVWVFWAQGLETAPAIVKKCVSQMRYLYGNRLNIIDENNLRYYIEGPMLPDMRTWASKSDVIRTELLMRYGGTWLDATVFVKDEFLELQRRESAIAAAYHHDYRQLGSWLLSVDEKYNYHYCLLNAALNMYLNIFKDFNTYFMFHTFWKILTHIDQDSKMIWENTYKLNATIATRIVLKEKLVSSTNDNTFLRFFDASPLHKLSYKFNEEDVRNDSYVSYIMRMSGDMKPYVSKEKCFGSDGVQCLGEIKIKDNWYYFNRDTGEMATGIETIIMDNGMTKTCYYDENGRMQYGCHVIDGKEYFFNEKTGSLEKGRE